MATMNALEQIKQLDEKRAKLLEEATAEAKKRAEEAIADLNALGYNYRLAQNGGKTTGKTGITRKRDPNAPCSICKFVTDPGHDGRMHRSQGKSKKPFTAEELRELGLKKK